MRQERVGPIPQLASAIQMDAETWHAIRMPSGLTEQCPHCGVSTRYRKTEYRFRDEPELDPAIRP